MDNLNTSVIVPIKEDIFKTKKVIWLREYLDKKFKENPNLLMKVLENNKSKRS